MLEELRENVLSLLEERVEHAISTIQTLRADKLSLESQIEQLRSELKQQEERIQELENRNEELQRFESELKQVQEEREGERQEVDREKMEIRDRLEGLMTMLNTVNEHQDASASDQSDIPEDKSDAPDFSETDTSGQPFFSDSQ